MSAGLRRHPGRLAAIVALLATIAPFSIDTYLPSFPAIGEELGGDSQALQLTLSLYLAGFAVSTLLHGPLADRFGRRAVALGGLLTYIAASLLCMLAPSMELLYAGRILQGISASSGVVIGRAMVRDAYAGAEAQRVMARVMLLFAIAPAVAPVIGGFLHAWLGWRAVFAFLALFGGLLMLLCHFHLPETLPLVGRQSIHPAAVVRTYARLLGSGGFLRAIAVIALNFAGFFLYVAASPTLLYQHLGYGEADFAYLFFPVVGGLMLGAFASGRLAGRVRPPVAVWIGFALMVGAVLANLGQAALLLPHPVGVIGPVVVYAAGMAIAMPSLTLIALEFFPTHRGTASAVQTFFQTGVNALVTGLAVAPLAGSQLGLAVGMGVLLTGGLVLWLTDRGVG